MVEKCEAKKHRNRVGIPQKQKWMSASERNYCEWTLKMCKGNCETLRSTFEARIFFFFLKNKPQNIFNENSREPPDTCTLHWVWVSHTKRIEMNKKIFSRFIVIFSSSYKTHERARGPNNSNNNNKKRKHDQTSNITRNNRILTVCNVELKDSQDPELVTYECKKKIYDEWKQRRK